jgi:hypothetical protein
MIKNKRTIKKLSKETYIVAIVILVLALVGGTWGFLNMKNEQDKQIKLALDTCNAVVPITTDPALEQTTVTDAVSQQRLDRINAIYDSLKLGSDFKLTNSNVFGNKRVYEWDGGRTYSSSKDFESCADVSDTVTKLTKSIEAAGFAYFENPYPGGADTELHYKSAKSEYIRINVSSKLRNDAFRDDAKGKFNLDPNAGPSSVTVKVNLDDNNE